MTEKYVSATYDTAIFEFTDPQVRDVLNHIQKEEQQHGEAIFKYISQILDLSSLHHTVNFHWLYNFTYGNVHVLLDLCCLPLLICIFA